MRCIRSCSPIRALDTYLKFGDEHNAASAASRLGIMLAQLGRHADAVDALLQALVSWHSATGAWSPNELGLLKRERRHLTGDEYAALIRLHVPADVTGELDAAIDQADEPQEDT
jgi:hypothetical protein